MGVAVLHVCDKFGVRGSSIHGVSRLFSWWFPRYDPARFEVTLCGLKREEPATRWRIGSALAERQEEGDHEQPSPHRPRRVEPH